MMRIRALLVLAASLAMGCASADVAGNYTVNLTNGDNGCSFMNWTVGDTTSGIPIVVTQSEDQVQLDIGGAGGTLLDVGLGSSIFNGTVGGSTVTAALIGSTRANQGMCSYTITIDLDANVNGDFMEGELSWRPVTNMHPDCGVLEMCRNIQSFNGSRPPP